MIYFAYGSNMDVEQMARRCPGAEPMGTARLPWFGLRFSGSSAGWGGAVAPLVPDPHDWVDGLLYRVNQDHVRSWS